MKTCPRCGHSKELTEFYTSKTHASGYASFCKSCESLRCKAKDAKYRERRLAKAQQWRDENRDVYNSAIARWRVNHPEWTKEYFKNHRETNRDIYNERYARRDASKKQRTPSWLSKEDVIAMRVEYALAAWCSKVMGEPYHVDHIIPLNGKQVSGLHVPCNLRVIPANANQRKSNKLLEAK